MFRFMQRFGRDSQARRRGTGPMTRVRRRNHRLDCEALESRQLLSGYYIVNAASGKVLDDPNFSSSNGTPIDQWQLNGGTNQQWKLVPHNGNYWIVNAYSNTVIGDPGFSNSNGTGIIQWQLNGGQNEQWQVDNLENGRYAIVNAYSNLALNDKGYSRSDGTSIIQWQWNGGMNEQWDLFVPNTTATTSPNWSGYAAWPNDSVTYVTGTWTVPTVTAASGTSGNIASCTWVGIDGDGNGTVEQIGTWQNVQNGVAHYFAWWEMFSKIGLQPEQTITTMTVSPGDSITASVTYQTSGTYAGDFLLSINDTSHSNDSFSKYANPQQYQDPSPVTFTNCYASISGTPVQVQALNLNRNGVTLDTTSVLTSGTSFSVLYDSSGTAGQSRTNANGVTHIGPTVGATLQSVKKTGRPVIVRPAGTGVPGLPRFRRPIGQHERFARGFLIDPTARDAIFAE